MNSRENWGSSALVKQTFLKENSKFKLALLRLKIDLVLHSAYDDGIGYIEKNKRHDFLSNINNSFQEYQILELNERTFIFKWSSVSRMYIKYICLGLIDYKSRREQVVISHLRIGHTRLTHAFILKQEPQPQCLTC